MGYGRTLMAFSMSPPVVLSLVACVALAAGNNYTIYTTHNRECAGAILDETNVLGVCALSVEGIGGQAGFVDKYQCDAKGNLVTSRWGSDVDPAKTAQRLADCEKNTSPTRHFTLIGDFENGVCKSKGYGVHLYYTKAEFVCPSPSTTGDVEDAWQDPHVAPLPSSAAVDGTVKDARAGGTQ